MKKLICLILSLTMAFSLAACGGKSGTGDNTASGNKSTAGTGGIADAASTLFGGEDASSANENNACAWAFLLSRHGLYYIPTYDGSYIELSATSDDQIGNACLTPDRSKVVVRLYFSGTLYYTDPKQKKQTVISENVFGDSHMLITDDGVFYEMHTGDKFDHLCRYTFSDGVTVDLGQVYDVCYAENTLSALYIDANGAVYILAADSMEPVQVGQDEDFKAWGDEDELAGISDDGQLAVWSYGYRNTTIVSENGQNTVLTEESEYAPNVTFSSDQKMAIIYSFKGNTVWIKQSGADVVTIEFPLEAGYNGIFWNIYAVFDYEPVGVEYSANGELSNQTAKEINSFYVMTSGETDYLYNVTVDGSIERVISDFCYDYVFASGNLFYRDLSDNLIAAEVNGAELSNQTLIDNNVHDFKTSPDGQYIYYMKDYNSDTCIGSLYVWKNGDSAPQKICETVAGKKSNPAIITSLDGTSVFYLYMESPAYFGGTYHLGALMRWDASTGESIKISDDAVEPTEYTISSGRRDGLDSSSFVFFKYSYPNTDDIVADLVYYDGEETTTLWENFPFNSNDTKIKLYG